MVSVRASCWMILVGLFAASGCKTRNPDAAGLFSEETMVEGAEPTGELKVCAAVRGNGHYLLTHFGSLARLTEHYGTIDALAGGSSATVTMFLHESMKQNPLVASAKGRDKDLRMALLLKSILGYVQVLEGTPEAESIMLLTGFVQKARAAGVFTLQPKEYQLAAEKLQELLSNRNLIELVNPNALAMLQDKDQLGYASYEYKVNELKASAQSITGFKAADQKIFFREGIVSFDGLASALGRMANFYAGYEPIDMNLMSDFVESCSVEAVNADKSWPVIAQTPTAKGVCGELFAKALKNFRASVMSGIAPSSRSRVDEPMGGTTIVSTAVLEGSKAVKLYNESLVRYRQAQDPKFTVDFKDVRFGYWVPEKLAAAVDAGMAKGAADGDGKLQKFLDLGHNVTWRDVLRASPAEPGLSRAVPLADDRISIGGWSDLAPVQVLQAAGCDKVVYVTRRDAESNFLVSPTPIDHLRAPLGVAEQLNMEEPDRLAIYDLQNQQSGFARALKAANSRGAVWCTDWNRFKDNEIAEMYLGAYDAEMTSHDPDMTSGSNAYKRQVPGPIVGCTVP